VSLLEGRGGGRGGCGAAVRCQAEEKADTGARRNLTRLRVSNRPDGEVELPNAERPADCFFIHPTGYFGTQDWNAPADDAQANERTGLMMGGQASAFSSACRVYAPKYRQSTIAGYALTGTDNEAAEAVFGVAYSDCSAAFRCFIAEHNQGRPFILASHSQGGHHMQRLLQDELEANVRRSPAPAPVSAPLPAAADRSLRALASGIASARASLPATWSARRFPRNGSPKPTPSEPSALSMPAARALRVWRPWQSEAVPRADRVRGCNRLGYNLQRVGAAEGWCGDDVPP